MQAELRTRGELPAPPAVTSSFVMNDSEAQLPDVSAETPERFTTVGVNLGDVVEEPIEIEGADGEESDADEEVETEVPGRDAVIEENYLALLATAAEATDAATSSSGGVTALIECTALAAADVTKLKVIAD